MCNEKNLRPKNKRKYFQYLSSCFLFAPRHIIQARSDLWNETWVFKQQWWHAGEFWSCAAKISPERQDGWGCGDQPILRPFYSWEWPFLWSQETHVSNVGGKQPSQCTPVSGTFSIFSQSLNKQHTRNSLSSSNGPWSNKEIVVGV